MISDSSTSKYTSPVLITAAVIIILAGFMAAKSIVIPLLLSMFIGIISAHPIRWLAGKGVPHWLSVILVLLGILLTIFLLYEVDLTQVSLFHVWSSLLLALIGLISIEQLYRNIRYNRYIKVMSLCLGLLFII